MKIQVDSVSFYFERLNWNSFDEQIGIAPRLFKGEDIKNLIRLSNSKKIDYLLKGLENKEKTVAIHIVLTSIYNPTYNRFGILDEGGPGVTFLYNNLKWRKHGNSKSVKKSDIQRIIQHWKKIFKDE